MPIPTGWTAATVEKTGVLTSPEGGITVYALALPGTEIPEARDRSWHIVDPTFDLTPGETLDVPARPSFDHSWLRRMKEDRQRRRCKLPPRSEENLTETWRPQEQIGPGFSYGLGWVISDYKEQPLLVHVGGTLGYSAEVVFLPEAGLGVTIIANQAGAMAFSETVRDRVFAMAFDQPAQGGAGIEFAVEQQRQAFAELAETLVPLDEGRVTPFLGA